MAKTVKTRKYSGPENLTFTVPPSSRIWNTRLLAANRSKELPKLRQNPAFWRRKKHIIMIMILVLVALGAGIAIGLAVGIHTHRSQAPAAASSTSSAASSSSTSSTSPTSPVPSTPPGTPPRRIPTALATTFLNSSWIWMGSQALTGVPAGDWAFRISLPTSPAPATTAIILLTVDDHFVLFHNGQLVANSTDLRLYWRLATAFPVSLDPNSNMFAIRANNASPGSIAGLIASIQISHGDGSTTTISSDSTWRVTQPIPDGFESPSFDDSQWAPATVLVKYGAAPWLDQVYLPPDVYTGS
ncbi:hypothetical protein BD779DRAFT_1475088 [Infundibulicybe gibba]|nr:hypothetical protein BD779DRAFT_1475088 [Infundibulicybe gibba]